MTFNVLGFVLATALTRDMKDRDQASQLELLGGLMGSSPLGLVLIATVAGQQSQPSTAVVAAPESPPPTSTPPESPKSAPEPPVPKGGGRGGRGTTPTPS
ncbi:hypothetical protein [Nocardia arthritidis]|uniref:Uncharacterized protein n=1 Tax=Nocardia arthritidis TaxID=228602 RepID=A0A6G9YLZ4_9NOCA|nr:hypothetical protein [Nocardia arthritidis]QIS14222.1 hypothetical protein F5544_31915 [Nocardia arthritidis]